MRGVSVDCANLPPTARRLGNAEMDSIRVEMRDLPEFYKYTERLDLTSTLDQAWLVGPSTGSLEPILRATKVRPQLVIIGNEPDVVGESSWTMTPDEYVSYYNETTALIRERWPTVAIATAGMYNASYALEVLPQLRPQPTYLNTHYPNSVEDIFKFDRLPGGPGKTIVGEWCWRTATEQEMYDWQVMLEHSTWHSFYFCWSDNMVPGMGLVTKSLGPTKSYQYYKAARRILHG